MPAPPNRCIQVAFGPQSRNLLFRYAPEQVRHRGVQGAVVYLWREARPDGDLLTSPFTTMFTHATPQSAFSSIKAGGSTSRVGWS